MLGFKRRNNSTFPNAMVLTVLCLLPSSALAEGSTFCFYSLLIETHQMVSHCGNPLDTASEQRYGKMLVAVRKSIIENSHEPNTTSADTAKMLDQYEAKLRARYLIDKGTICKSPEYPGYRKMLDQLIDPKSFATTLEGLKTHKDPNKGECL